MNIEKIIEAAKSAGATIKFIEISFSEAGAEEKPASPAEYKCEECGKRFEPFVWKGREIDAKTASEWSVKRNGRPLCLKCGGLKIDKTGA